MNASRRELREIVSKAVRPTLVDRLVSYVAPVAASRRMRARAFMALAGGYLGDAKSRRVLQQWNPKGYDADSDILPDLPALREFSRDLVRKSPLATGAVKTKVTNVVGGGFMLKAQLDADFLSFPEESAQQWEKNTEREWRLFFNAKTCGVEWILTGLPRNQNP